MGYFDKAINDVLDGIEHNALLDQVREAASAALDEYPSKEGQLQSQAAGPHLSPLARNSQLYRGSHLLAYLRTRFGIRSIPL